MANPHVQLDILEILGADWEETEISMRRASISPWNFVFALTDPVGLLLVDGQGRRLGWTPETGVLTEIPDSVWYGEGDGLGFASGELLLPLRVELSGLGGDYVAQVAGLVDGAQVGYEERGTLASGEERRAEVATRELASATLRTRRSRRPLAELPIDPR